MVPNLRFSGPNAIYHFVSRNARRIIDAAGQVFFCACKNNTALVLVNLHFDEAKKQFFAAQKMHSYGHPLEVRRGISSVA